MSDVPVSIAYGEKFVSLRTSTGGAKLTAIKDVLMVLDSSAEIPFIKTVQ